jgi:hypothetical protein
MERDERKEKEYRRYRQMGDMDRMYIFVRSFGNTKRFSVRASYIKDVRFS